MNFISSGSKDVSQFEGSQKYNLEDKVEPMGHVRKMIAQHMIKSRDTSVHVYSTTEVDMTNIVTFRNAHKRTFEVKYNTPLTYTPFIIDSSIKAIHEYPLLNACLEDKDIKFNQNINIGVAVAITLSEALRQNSSM